MRQQKGFTLLEIIVVVALAGIIVGGVLLNSSLINPHHKFEALTQNIAKLLRYAHQEGGLNNENYALSVTKTGYVFLMLQGDEWVPIQAKPLQPQKKLKDFKQQLLIDTKLVEPLKKGKFEPHILILASGEMSPFEWTLSDIENDISITIIGSFNGQIKTSQQAL